MERLAPNARLPFALEGRRPLCRVADISDGGAKGFSPAPGGFTGLMAIRRGDGVFVYVNSCPHLGTPLDWTPNRFLPADGRRIVCVTQGAEFAIADGVCIRGPAQGDRLESVMVEISDGMIYVSSGAGL